MRQLTFIAVLVGVVNSLPTYPYHNVHPEIYALHPGGIGGIFKGPGSETIIRGPDGSVITSEQRGGLVAAKPEVIHTAPIISVQPQPVLVARQPIVSPQPQPIFLAQPRPILVDSGPIVVPDVLAEVRPKIEAEHVLVGHKVIIVPKQVNEDSDLVGPSGTISVRGDDAIISGPASLTVKGDGVVADIRKTPITTVITSAPVLTKAFVQDTVVIPAPALIPDTVLTHSVVSPTFHGGLVDGSFAPSAIIEGPSVGAAVISGPTVARVAVLGPKVGPAIIRGPEVAPTLVVGPYAGAGLAHSSSLLATPLISPSIYTHHNPIVGPQTILTGAYEASLTLPVARPVALGAGPHDLVATNYGSSYLPHGNAAAYYAKPVYRGVL